MSIDFKVGERVRLSELGKKASPRMRVQTGRVVGPELSIDRGAVKVLFDGNKRPTRLHPSYIERVPPVKGPAT